MEDIVFVRIEELKEHEEIRPDYLEDLKNEILSDGILKMPIAVDRDTYVILDGHHRLHALKRIGCKRIPVVLVDYHPPASRCWVGGRANRSPKRGFSRRLYPAGECPQRHRNI
ncbi:MAG: ParB N-terminal domain-containing protein [Deltaproteobacteria bacterium]|nr:ParB N-terminal domain-containing protein [Deltaproteobacteria bacterium]